MVRELRIGIAVALVAGFGLIAAPIAGATTLTVNSTADNTAEDDACSLREALTAVESNAAVNPGGAGADCPAGAAGPVIDEIDFNIAGAGPHAITLGSDLPTITDPVAIDGSSEPDFAGTPIVEIDAGAFACFALFNADGSSLRGLAITGCASFAIQTDSSSDVTIAGNYLGLEPDGNTPNGATSSAIEAFFSQGLRVGGTSAADRNVIGGAGSHGMRIANNSSDVEVLGNYVGVGADGTTAAPNGAEGLSLDGATTDVQVGQPGAGNVFAYNRTGVRVSNSGTTDVRIQSNRIGVDVNDDPAGNTGVGVLIRFSAAANLVGSSTPGEGNVIAHNGRQGVLIDGASTDTDANAILGNSIFGNGTSGLFGTLGIDVGDPDPTANDALDADSGSNEEQNFPVIEAAAPGSAHLRGTLQSEPSKSYRIELFANPTASDTGNLKADAERFLGATTTSTDASGNGSWLFSEAAATLVSGEYVTATATELDGSGNPLNTSELAAELVAPTCDVTGTAAGEPLAGASASAEIICGFGGGDTINPGATDIALAGDGNDTVNARNGARETAIDCGPGQDIAIIDEADADAALKDCETVTRPSDEVVSDTTPPILDLTGRKKQKSKRSIKVATVCNEDCTATLSGSVRIPVFAGKASVAKRKKFKLGSKTLDLAADERKTTKLKLPKKARKALKKAFKRGKKAKAKVSATATDAVENTGSKQTLKVTLKGKKRR